MKLNEARIAAGKLRFEQGMRLYEALMVLPPEARPTELTHLPDDGEWMWDYTTLSRAVYADGVGEVPCGTAGCLLGMARALRIISVSNDLQLADALGLLWSDVNDLAYGHSFGVGMQLMEMQKIGPHTVAKELKRLLAERYPELIAEWETVHA